MSSSVHLRLVKLRLPVDLLRAMDLAIVTSGGTYQDRNDFVAEAVWDRLNEDAASSEMDTHGSSPTKPHPVDSSMASSPLSGYARADAAEREGVLHATTPRGDVTVASATQRLLPLQALAEGAADVPTLERLALRGHNFGLHNRDLPSLWLATRLAQAAQEAEGPVPWNVFTAGLRSHAQQAAATLVSLDESYPQPVKVATGFPRGGDKARLSEDRFISVALGTPTREGAAGPAFLLGLVAADEPANPRPAIAPTHEAVRLLSALGHDGLRLQLPQPSEAAQHWLEHIAAVNPEEYGAWLRVLQAVQAKPTRPDLIAMFPQWRGSQADTNCMGYISRSREWGLVRADIEDSRYLLTDLGEQVLAQHVTGRYTPQETLLDGGYR